MASNIPTRRVTRTTRPVVLKDENANANPRSRIVTRTKPPSSTNLITQPGIPTRLTATTVATRTKAVAKDALPDDPAAQGKRKRSTLGEVTVNKPKARGVISDKGKAKEGILVAPASQGKFAGVVIKAKPAATTDAPQHRPALRSVAVPVPLPAPAPKRTTRSSTVVNRVSTAHQAPLHVDAMAIDPPEFHAPPSRANGHSRKPSSSIAVPRRTSTVQTIKEARERDDMEAEANRVFKKRRTSSEPPEDRKEEAKEQAGAGDQIHDIAEKELQKHLQDIEREAEADPNGPDWEDLDAEDVDDPMMVSEYVNEIFDYLKVVEQNTLPNPNYMDSQKDLAWKMRGILTDWLIQVHTRFRLLPETLYLAVNIIDRFLSARVVSLAKLQLVGITCMFLAAKVEEIVAPSAMNFLYCADSSYTEQEILQAEKYILKTLEWNMGYPNPIHFLRRVSKADEYNVQARTVAKYFLEIECVEWRLIAAPPSLLAAAAMWLARFVLGKEDWTPNLAHYSSYAESAIIPTANLMINYVLKPVRHGSFFKKYAAKKFMKASTYVRSWALERWPENTQVNLAEELSSLKALIRAQRERAIAAGIDPDAIDIMEEGGLLVQS
ncbi:cyclin-like protein [Russula earlei]|uniref:Cyclin-like protein n=1 Tax=Russula earlei TaxID=71964 RepID=A0ACC0U8R6_9AGAM|nr:cyclin-like protein [Russula earlei]